MIGLAILGSTGSIGTQALQLVREHPDKFIVTALTARANIKLLAEQYAEFKPGFVGVADEHAAKKFRDITGVPAYSGKDALLQACSVEGTDTVLVAVVGIAGLPAVMECIRLGKKIALANKEAMVTGGEIINRMLDQKGMRIIPVDSEHSAIFQCLNGQVKPSRLILTASGGPFRDFTISELENVTTEQALRHPRWNMGKKITIDSATLMNKGLEIIEARWLFRIPHKDIDCVIHPESIIHSMVEFEDSSVIAQMGEPDMRIPILYALTYPQRLYSGVKRLDLKKIGALHFYEPDYKRFPCLSIARSALDAGGTAPVVLNAANEEAVDLFLRHKIKFTDIPKIIEKALNNIEHIANPNIDDIYCIDSTTRKYVLNIWNN
ncbi:MAG TPA: 1-deoxy-D-xylulose-5-phosphate reductoisomerase [Clostridia bacterium]|nr:1-deoxy-D-xylulose-5-phosphate reductoisomerase [Clostridia bacterium]